MKKVKEIFNFSVLVALFFAAYAFNLKPECDPEVLLKNCASDLDDFVFIKSFPIETKKEGDKTEYSYVLSRAVNYKIVVCNQSNEEKKMIVNLFDRNKKL